MATSTRAPPGSSGEGTEPVGATKFTHDEFDCLDCGQHIISLPALTPPPERCAVCLWLREFAPGDEALRRRVLKLGTG